MTVDISLDTFEPAKRYTGVRHQQGRVLPDASWNEAVDVASEARALGVGAAMGRSGVPIDAPDSFGVAIVNGALQVSGGRIYVDGRLVESPGAPPADPLPGGTVAGRRLVYLEAWERSVSHIQDPAIREPALERLDTTTRTLTVCRVRHAALPDGAECRDRAAWVPPERRWLGTMEARLVPEDQPDAACFDDSGTFAPPFGNQLYRIQVLHGGALRRPPLVEVWTVPNVVRPGATVTVAWSLENVRDATLDGQPIVGVSGAILVQIDATREFELRAIADDGVELTDTASVAVMRFERADSPEIVVASPVFTRSIRIGGAVTVPFFGVLPTTLPDFSALPSALHPSSIPTPIPARPSDRPIAFIMRPTAPIVVYCRDNGSVEAEWLRTIDDASGVRLVVRRASRDPLLRLRGVRWVELRHDGLEAGGQTGLLVEVVAVAQTPKGDAELTIDAHGAGLPDVELLEHPYVRRWDVLGAAEGAATPIDYGTWLSVEHGIEVRFSTGLFEEGAHWRFPSRAFVGPLGGTIGWPTDAAGSMVPRAPDGIRRTWSPLAILAGSDKGWEVAHDCRKRFRPLTGIAAARIARIEGMAGEPIENDASVPASTLATGLRFICDDAVDPASIGGRTTIKIAVELPLADADSTAPYGFARFELDGVATVEGGNAMVWRLTNPGRQTLLRRLVRYTRERLSEDAVGNWPLLAWLHVHGNFVWAPQGRPDRHLDGDALGETVTGSSRIALALPSGDRVPGGDLAVWIWLDRPDCGPPSVECRNDGRTVFGTVMDDCGPVADAALVLSVRGAPDRVVGRTDDDGNFAFPVLRLTSGEVAAVAPSGARATLEVTCWRQDCGPLRLDCQTQGRTSRITVRDDCGLLSGVDVRIEARGQTLARGRTDGEGLVVLEFGAPSLVRGDLIAVHLEDRREARMSFPCCGDPRVDCVGGGGFIHGIVRDDCDAHPGSLIRLVDLATGAPLNDGVTQDGGRFTFRADPAGDAEFRGVLLDGRAFRAPFDCPGTLTPEIRISNNVAAVRVRDAAGAVPQNARLDVLRAAGEPVALDIPLVAGDVNARIPLPGAGEYLFAAWAADGARGLGVASIRGDAGALTIVVQRAEAPILSGEVADNRGPVGDAMVTAMPLPDRMVTHAQRTPPDSGVFRFVGLAPGFYELGAVEGARSAPVVVIELRRSTRPISLRPNLDLMAIPGVGPARQQLFLASGITHPGEVAELELERVMTILGVGESVAARVIDAAAAAVMDIG